MSDSFINQTSRVAIAGRVAEHHRPQYWTELTLRGDYHAPSARLRLGQSPLSGFVSSNLPVFAALPTMNAPGRRSSAFRFSPAIICATIKAIGPRSN